MEANFLSDSNPYQAYTDGDLGSNNPLRLVIALYEGALEATRCAAGCLEAGDIWGRSKAINKTVAILSELLASLDLAKGGDIAQNLKRLYGYMQTRLLEAHARQAAAPLKEVEKLLGTLLEGWHQADETQARAQQDRPAPEMVPGRKAETFEALPYAAYFNDVPETLSGTAFSF
jgi:flagellar protein FliS